MATWDIVVSAQSAQGATGSGNSTVTPAVPGDFDGATINSVTILSSPTVTADSNPTTDDGCQIRFWVETTGSTAVYGADTSGGHLCDAIFPQSATSSVTITANGSASPAPTTAVAADWDRVGYSLAYNANMKNDGELFSWSAFTIRVTYTPLASDFRQNHYQFTEPTTGDAHEAWPLVGSEDTSFEITIAQLDVNHALIIKLLNAGDGVGSLAFQLEYNVDGGGWNPVDVNSDNVRVSVSVGDSNGATSFTERLTAAAGTFDRSILEASDGSQIADLDNGEEQETYYAIIFRSADLGGGETITFRLTTAGETVNYDITPTATIEAGGGAVNEVTLPTGAPDPLAVTDADVKLRLRTTDLLDTITATDSPVMLRQRIREILDEITATDDFVAIKSKAPVVLTDDMAVTDAQVMLRQRIRELLNNIDATDAIVAIKQVRKIVTESHTVTDDRVIIRERIRGLLDNLATTDNSIGIRSHRTVLGESVAVVDPTDKLRLRDRDLLDTAPIDLGLETIRKRVVTILNNVVETNITDNITAIVSKAPAIGLITDPIDVIDTEIMLRMRFRELLDEIAVTDSEVPLTIRARLALDTIAVTDFATALKIKAALLSDEIAVVDAEVKLRSRFRDLIDTIDIIDTAITLRDRSRDLLDEVTATDDAIELRERYRLTLDEVAVTDAEDWFRLAQRVAAETIAVTDDAIELRERSRVLLDNIAVVDNVIGATGGVIARTLSDVIAVVDSLVMLRERYRLMLDEVTATDAEDWFREARRVITDAIAVSDIALIPEIGTILRDEIAVTDVETWYKLAVRDSLDEITATDAETWYKEARRVITDAIAVTDILLPPEITTILQDTIAAIDANIELRLRNRVLLDTIAVVDNTIVTVAGTISRTLLDEIAATDAHEELRLRFRELLDNIAVTDAVTAAAIRTKVTVSTLLAFDDAYKLRNNIIEMTSPLDVTDNAIATHVVGGIIVNAITILELLSVTDTTDAEKIFNMTKFAIKHGIDKLQIDDKIENFHILNKIRRET